MNNEAGGEIIQAYPFLELGDFLISQSVCLGNDGNKVDFGVQSAHKLNIQLLEPKVHISEHGCGII